jgi:hypothetical protein
MKRAIILRHDNCSFVPRAITFRNDYLFAVIKRYVITQNVMSRYRYNAVTLDADDF